MSEEIAGELSGELSIMIISFRVNNKVSDSKRLPANKFGAVL